MYRCFFMQYSRRQEYRSLSLQYAFPFLGLFLFREKRFALTADRKISSRTNDSSLYSGAFRLHCRSNIWEKRKAFLCRFPAALNAHANPITATRILALKGESPRRKVACKGRRCDMVAAAARGRNGARKKMARSNLPSLPLRPYAAPETAHCNLHGFQIVRRQIRFHE